LEHQSLLKNKKGNVALLAPAVITLLFAAILLVFAVIVLQEAGDVDNDVRATVNNETITSVVNGAARTVTHNATNRCSFNTFAVTLAMNATGGQTIPASNYTVNSATGQLTATGSGAYNNTNWNVTYTYLRGDQACTSADTSRAGMATFANFYDIIVIGVVISVVIGLILLAFSGSRAK